MRPAATPSMSQSPLRSRSSSKPLPPKSNSNRSRACIGARTTEVKHPWHRAPTTAGELFLTRSSNCRWNRHGRRGADVDQFEIDIEGHAGVTLVRTGYQTARERPDRELAIRIARKAD